MHKLMELKEMLVKQLEEYSSKELSAGTLDVVDKLAHAIKNICKIIEAYEEEEYSNNYGGSYDGMSRTGGSYRGGSYARGGNQGGGRRYSYEDGGSYARGRGRNARRDSMGRYSREDGYSRGDGYSLDSEEMVQNLRELMQDAPDEKTRQLMNQMIHKMEQM